MVDPAESRKRLILRTKTGALRLLLTLGLLVGTLDCQNTVADGRCLRDADCGPGGICSENGSCAKAPTCVLPTDCSLPAVCTDGYCLVPVRPDGGPTGQPDGGDGNGNEGGAPVLPPGLGVVRVSEVEIDFGSPAFGVGIQRTVSLLNLGEGPLILAAISRGDSTSEEFTWETERSLPATMDVGERMEITLVYTLSDGEEDLGSVYLHTDAQSCDPTCPDPANIEIALLSEFKGARNLEVTPEEHDFGYVPIGQSGATRTLLLTNVGTLDKVLTVQTVQVTGDVAQFDFEVRPTPYFVAPGPSVEIDVSYAPNEASVGHSITFTVSANSDNPANVTQQAVFRGASEPPNALVFDPPELIFPELVIGNAARQFSVLRNQGSTSIQVTALEFGAQNPVEYYLPPDAQPVTAPFVVPPGSGVAVFVEFRASASQASVNQLRALNDQASGDVPVLSVRGSSYVPPGGPKLEITMGPEDDSTTRNCICDGAGDASAANIDLSYRAPSGAVCGKPQDPSCALGGGNCACPALASYGTVSWGAARLQPVQGEQWIIEERIRHEDAGQNGSFFVQASLLDNCLAVPESAAYGVLYACCLIDCDGTDPNLAGEPGPQACFDYPQFPICSTFCEPKAYSAASQNCLKRGPVRVRTKVRTYGGMNGEQIREFCHTMTQNGENANVLAIVRDAGYFTVGTFAPGVVEVSPNQLCP